LKAFLKQFGIEKWKPFKNLALNSLITTLFKPCFGEKLLKKNGNLGPKYIPVTNQR
jgi:hypothetical protein